MYSCRYQPVKRELSFNLYFLLLASPICQLPWTQNIMIDVTSTSRCCLKQQINKVMMSIWLLSYLGNRYEHRDFLCSQMSIYYMSTFQRFDLDSSKAGGRFLNCGCYKWHEFEDTTKGSMHLSVEASVREISAPSMHLCRSLRKRNISSFSRMNYIRLPIL